MSLKIRYMKKPTKKRPAIKGKANLKKRKTARAVNHFLLRLRIPLWPNAIVKILIFFEKVSESEQMQTKKHCITCLFTLMQTTKKFIFHVCAWGVPLQVLICYVNTRLLGIIDRFCWKVRDWVLSLIRAMYWDTSKDVWHFKNLGFISLNVQYWSSVDNVV